MADVRPKIELWPLDRLLPYARNARTHSDEQVAQIAASIREFGFTNPVLADAQGIVAGHGRVLALRQLYKAGFSVVLPGGGAIDPGTAPVIDCTGWSDAQRRAYIIADNKLALNAGWDEDLLAVELGDLQEAGFDLGLVGFDADELADLFATDPEETEEGEIPPPPDEPITREGDIWLCGPHRVACGDFFDEDFRKRALGGQRVAGVVTDPPYAIYGSSTGVESDVADDKMVRPFFENLGKVIRSLLPEYAHAYLCCDWRSWSSIWEAMKRSDLTVCNMIVWSKHGSGLGSNYANTHELIAFVQHRPKTTQMRGGKKSGVRAVNRPNIFTFARPHGDQRQHNAAKPVDLMREFVRNSTDTGELVLDPFGGSGSTLIACAAEKRACVTTEMEPRFCDVIVQRWQHFTKEKATRESDGVPFGGEDGARTEAEADAPEAGKRKSRKKASE